ncbi:uncharacterized protein LOC129741110 [Uranotaenia lowii]|uniref:uncharacterized protein LOC129741110 n=1 Tax=Uranotaenia lowii TaxID=190385 RepID=UPI00247A3DFF|nr:uncharacterized protein LOC129741110 [Uranotaenia lowii]
MDRSIRNTLLLVLLAANIVWAKSVPQSKLKIEHEEKDATVIQMTLKEAIKEPSVQFIEYGPDGKDGFKYHLAAGDTKQYVIHTTGPVAIPIVEQIKGTREDRDRKLLERLIESSGIKSMDTVSSVKPAKE